MRRFTRPGLGSDVIVSKTTWLYLACLAAVAHIWFSTSGGHLLIPLLCRPFYPTQLPTPVVVCSPLGLVYLAPLWFYSCLIDAESLPSVEKHRVHPKAFVIRDCLESELRPLAQRPPRPLSLLKQSLGRVGGHFPVLHCFVGLARHHHRLCRLRSSPMLMPRKRCPNSV